jgi:glycosyltransferase involved in cell wall biosynthesis
MKISVIMPVYNSEKYLKDAIDSVLSQKGAELEIIAVEDCSKDSSRELLRALAESEPRIKAYYNEKNIGVAEVRNRALEYATGDFLAFCDSDDIVPSGAYAALMDTIGDADIAVGAYDNFHDDTGSDGICTVSDFDKKSLFRSMFSVSCLWTKLIRRSFVADNNLKFDTDMTIGEDVVFLANLVMKNPSFKVTDALVYHHCHHNTSVSRSLTHVYTLRAFEMHIECRRRVLTICESLAEIKDYIYLRFSSFICSFIPLMTSDDEKREAFELYKKYLLGYDFSKNKKLFRFLVGVPYDNFENMTLNEYLEIRASTPPREAVLCEFECGAIGFRWIFKYFKAWFKYKLKLQ